MGRGIEVAKLKCYSCPECGSFLEVDRVSDTFDCPFCGSHFDAVDFHGKDLLEQAQNFLRRNDFRSARERYSYLLSKNPNEFEYLYGYACAVGEYSSLAQFSDPKRYSNKLTELFTNDERYKQGPAAPYFAKYVEMFEISRNYTGLISEQKKLFESSKAELEAVEREKIFGPGKWFGWFTTIFIGAGIYFFAPYLFALRFKYFIVLFAYCTVPVIVYLCLWLSHKHKMKVKKPEFEARIKNADATREKAAGLNNDLSDLKTHHDFALKELNDLKLVDGLRSPLESKKKTTSTFEVTAIPSRFYMSRKSDASGKEIPNAGLCNKCGAELRLDKVRKLFVCDHCGTTYDYEVFIGDLRTKANKCLADGEFGPADKWYAKILEGDPKDLEALRGRVFCAAKWRSSSQVSLVEDMDPAMRKDITDRINEAIVNSDGSELDYFLQVQSIFNIIINYADACYALKGNVLTKDIPKWEKKKQALTSSFNSLFHPFVKMDITVIRKVRAGKIQNDKA